MANVKLLICLFMLTVVVCEVFGKLPTACRQPLKIGPCRAHIRKWYYNNRVGRCLQFHWGGCRANGNNFKTKAVCEKKCGGRHLPKERPRWYFDKKSGKCKRFVFRVFHGHRKYFFTKKQCLRWYSIPAICKFGKKTGNCRGRHFRYFYNTKKGRCEKFVYGGCGGNANNFKTWKACTKRCKISIG